MKTKTVIVQVSLNGTKKNPWHMYGLTQNPFPAIGKYEYYAACMRLQSLGGEPIPNVEYIRERLKGFDPEFVEGVCKRFVPGKYVRFIITFPLED